MSSALPLSAADADGQVDEAGGGSALCHALVDTWRGSVGLRVPFVSVVLAAASTLELVAELRVDSCVFVFDLPPGYAADTAPMPWEHGGLPIGSVDSSLLVPGPTIRVEAHDPSSRSPLTSTGFAAALGKSVEMGLVVGTAQAYDAACPRSCGLRTPAPKCSAGPLTRWLAPCPSAGMSVLSRSARGWAVPRPRTRPPRVYRVKQPRPRHDGRGRGKASRGARTQALTVAPD